jgi:hypothetical protein
MTYSTKGRYVRVTKIESHNAELPAATTGEYTPGEPTPEGKSLPDNYWIEGTFFSDIVAEKSMLILREIRNGEKVAGLFTSSQVVSFTEENDHILVKTLNSSYRVEFKEKEIDPAKLLWN